VSVEFMSDGLRMWHALEKKTSQYFCFGKSVGKTAHGGHKRRWEDNTVLNRLTSTGGCSD
jgi:hypothetical protein